MTHYLLTIYRHTGYDPTIAEDAAMAHAIDALNEEMVAAGIRVFVGGLHPTSSAKSLRTQPNGDVVISDGAYLKAEEYVGGFWVLETTDLDEALTWGRKAAIACWASVEVRPFH